MSKHNINPNRAPLRGLFQDLTDLGLIGEPAPFGAEHVLRECSLPDGGHGVRAQTSAGHLRVYTWKPNVAVQNVDMTKDEALTLAALIYKTWPLDGLANI